jgi:hypothetical protein
MCSPTSRSYRSVRKCWVCREDFGIERNQSPEKLSTVTHNSVFAAHRLKNAVPRLRDGIFLFWVDRLLKCGFAAILTSSSEISIHHYIAAVVPSSAQCKRYA